MKSILLIQDRVVNVVKCSDEKKIGLFIVDQTLESLRQLGSIKRYEMFKQDAGNYLLAWKYKGGENIDLGWEEKIIVNNMKFEVLIQNLKEFHKDLRVKPLEKKLR